MPTSSSIRQLQEQFGGELVAALVQEIPLADLRAALLEESHPLAKDLLTAVTAAVDAGCSLARQIVMMTLAAETERRNKEGMEEAE